MHDIELVSAILIFIMVWMRYKSNNGMFNVIAGLIALGLTITFGHHTHDIVFTIALGLMAGYLFYDGLLK